MEARLYVEVFPFAFPSLVPKKRLHFLNMVSWMKKNVFYII
jgi:hypothetical protein